MNFDEFTEVHEDELTKEPKDYKIFAYYYEGIPIEEDVANQIGNQ